MFPYGLISSTTWCLPGPCACYSSSCTRTMRVPRPTTHVIRGTGRSSTYMNSLSVEDRWRHSRNGSCSLHKSRRSKQERCIASCFRNKNDFYACRDLDLWFATASRKSQIQYMYFHVWEIANVVICYGFLTLKGKICNGLLQICDLCLWITNTNEIWECSNKLTKSISYD